MKRGIIATLLALAFVAYSCTVNEDPLPSGGTDNDGKVVAEPTATIEPFVFDDGAATKTVLSIDENTGANFTFESTDWLGVYPYDPVVGNQVQFSVKEQTADHCTFNGGGFTLTYGQLYAAYYPLCNEGYGSATAGISSASMMTQIPVDYTTQRQTSTDGKTFDISRTDYLVANGITPEDGTCYFTMSHIGALVVMDVTFTKGGTFTELSLTSDVAPFLLTGTIDLTQPITLSSDGPAQGIVIDAEKSSSSISLTLGEAGEGLEIEDGQTVRFCMMVAPVNLKETKSNLTLSVFEATGKPHSVAVKPRNFRQGYAYRVSCTLDEPVRTNLSENGTSNCYIVDVDNIDEAGYSFDCTVAGNGAAVNKFAEIFVYTDGNNYAYPKYGASTLAEGYFVRVPMNQNNCIDASSVKIADGKISFKATGAKGNAKIQMRDANDDGVWSWTIWCTDKPAEIEFENFWTMETHTILDRNLGAITSEPGCTEAECGLYFMFGCPLGFTVSDFEGAEATNVSMETQLAHFPVHPFVGPSSNCEWFNQFASASYANQVYAFMWGGFGNAASSTFGPSFSMQPAATAQKTMYDPCPVGYKVMAYDVLDGYFDTDDPDLTEFSADKYGTYIEGTDGTLFFPYNGIVQKGGYIYNWFYHGPYHSGSEYTDYVSLWTSAHNRSNMAYAYLITGRSESWAGSGSGAYGGGNIISHGMGVRCIAE